MSHHIHLPNIKLNILTITRYLTLLCIPNLVLATSLTLPDFVTHHISNTPLHHLHSIETSIQYNQVEQAKSKFWPQINYQTVLNKTTTSTAGQDPLAKILLMEHETEIYPSAPSPYRHQLGLSIHQTLSSGGKRKAQTQIEELKHAKLYHIHQQTRHHHIYNATLQYWNYYQSLNEMKNIKKQAQLTQKKHELITLHYQEGALSKHVIDTSKTNLQHTLQHLHRSVAHHTLSKQQIQQSIPTKNQPIKSLTPPQTHKKQTLYLKQLIHKTALFNPTYQLQIDQKIQDQFHIIAQSEFYPTIQLESHIYFFSNGHTIQHTLSDLHHGSTKIGIRISGNLFSGFKDTQKTELTQLKSQSLIIQKQTLIQKTQTELNQLIQNGNLALSRLRTAEINQTHHTQQYQTSQDALQLSHTTQITNIDQEINVISAQTNWLKAAIQSEIELAKLATKINEIPTYLLRFQTLL